MGHPRRRPKRLAQKLRQIRFIFDLSPSELLTALGVEEEISYPRISDYELGKTDPSLFVLNEYARVAGVHLELITDDRLDLPEKLPGTVTYEAWTRPSPKRPKTS